MQDQERYSISFRIESSLDQISLVRAAMSGVFHHLGVIEADIFSLELAVSEIINNIIEHGYGGALDHAIDVQVTIAGSLIEIKLKDNATPFPEDQLHRLQGDPPILEESTEDWPMRGHGLQIVRQIVDTLDIRSDEQGNCMKLTKQVTRLDR
ncbi:MAG: ATP-binding protein [Edaphobacter sp.]|uniref:ATP-binding protein n=1 Tax=Edaphobacter sp. TaxID=1934404 RepID=UPI0023A05B05|nr:ATP-binding protein [Edaphobacter sp.]MDE1175192.1 ATP-binding protein [Edaphobacter sp.]